MYIKLSCWVFSVPSGFPLQPSIVVSKHTFFNMATDLIFLPPLFSLIFFSCLSVLSCSKVKWWKIRNRIYLVNWVLVLVCILSLPPPDCSFSPHESGSLPVAFPSTHCFSCFYHFRVVPGSVSRPVLSPEAPSQHNELFSATLSWKQDSTESVISFSFCVCCSSSPELHQHWLTVCFPPTIIFM